MVWREREFMMGLWVWPGNRQVCDTSRISTESMYWYADQLRHQPSASGHGNQDEAWERLLLGCSGKQSWLVMELLPQLSRHA
jgi:hypothetical protein